jgi:Ca2+:H+ antiporter
MVGFISLAIGRDYPLLNVDMLMLEMYISHVASIVMIVLYAFYQLFKIRTHSFLWDTVEFGSDSENDDDVEYTRTVQASRLILLIVTLGGALACMWYCARNIFDISLVAELHHSRHFIVAILLPFTTHVSHYWKTYRATYTHSVDIAMGLTLATNAHIMLFDLPLLVLVGWAMQMPVTLNLGLTSTILLIICIYVSTHLIGNGKSNYLIGGMYIAM